MSAVPNDQGVTFAIRASRDQLAADMAAAKTQIVADTQKVWWAAKAVIDKDPIKPRFSVDEQEVRRTFAGTLKALQVQAKQALLEVKVRAKFDEIGGFNANLEARERFKATAGASGGGVDPTEGGGGILGFGKHVTKFARGAVVITAVSEAAGLFFNAASAYVALFQGDAEKFGRVIEQTANELKDLPLLGMVVKRFESFLGMISGISADIQKAADDTKNIDANTARMAIQAKREQEAIANAARVAGGVGVDPSVILAGDVQFAEKRKRERGGLDAALKAAPEGERGHLRAEAEQRFQAEDIARQRALEDRQTQTAVQAESARLRAMGEIRAADNLEFTASLEKRETDAARQSQHELANAKDVSNALREERKQRLAAEDADSEAAAKQERDRQIELTEVSVQELERRRDADREAERERFQEIGDLSAEADEKKMRRLGRDEEAQTSEIVRRAKQEIEAAQGDAEKKAAIIRNAEEDVLATGKSVRPRESLTVSGSAALAGAVGNQATVERLGKTQLDALGVLRQIRDQLIPRAA